MVFSPEYIRQGYFFLSEDDAESLFIFFLSLIGFLLYLAKERALRKIRGEQKKIRQEKNIIFKDLESSYSYIGELNRKFEILKRSVGALPGTLATFGRTAKDDELYQPILDAVKILSKADSVAIYFVHTTEHRIERSFVSGKKGVFSDITHESLLHEKVRHFWLENDHYRVASPKAVDHFRAFIVFPKKSNEFDDYEIFKILASEALFLFCLVRRGKGISKRVSLKSHVGHEIPSV